MTEPDKSSEIPSADQQRKARRTALIVIWANVLVVTGALIYVMWFWHAAPVTWQRWAFRLIWTYFFFYGIHRILAKTFAE